MTTEVEAARPEARRDNQDPDLFGQTPSQTVGPFFHYSLPWKGAADLVGPSQIGARPELVAPGHDQLSESLRRQVPRGEVIEITGVVTDGNGEVVPDALIEIWQADAGGHYAGTDTEGDPNFVGFGRASTDESGVYRFRTIRPGRVPGPGNALQAPHLAISVLGRGLIKRLATRLYFEDGEGLDYDPVLMLVPETRRDTLIARRDADGHWRFDIRLQGDGETVFFDL